MAAATAELTIRQYDIRGNNVDAAHEVPFVYATADTIWSGTAVEILNGLANPCGVTAGAKFLGICDKTIVFPASSNTTHQVSVNVSGPVLKNVLVAGVTAKSDRGRTVYLPTGSDNFAVDLTLTRVSTSRMVGEVYDLGSSGSGYADVKIYIPAEIATGGRLQLVPIVLNLAVTTADTTKGWSAALPGAGRVVALVGTNAAAITDTGTQAITAFVNDAAVTGTLTVTTALAGARIEQAITQAAASIYALGSTISISNDYTATLAGGPMSIFALVEVQQSN